MKMIRIYLKDDDEEDDDENSYSIEGATVSKHSHSETIEEIYTQNTQKRNENAEMVTFLFVNANFPLRYLLTSYS